MTSDDLDEPSTLYPNRRDDPTLAPPAAATFVPTLTIQWHPDVSRIGESASLHLPPGRSVRVTRKEPVFGQSGRQERPLDHLSVSGKDVSFTLVCVEASAYQLHRGDARTRVKVGADDLVEPRALTDEDLDVGVSIVVGDVALYLHLAVTPRPSAAVDDLGIIGVSDVAQALRVAIRNTAAFRTPILIRGESGAGKGHVARALHSAGPRPHGPLVEVNMTALTRDLVPATLFGHERGAFTGATTRSNGKFVDAHGGTLFLDEIGDAPIAVQQALLKAVEDHEVVPVGTSRPTKVDVRVVAATNADLAARIRDRTFLPELLSRLTTDEISIPPLRAHREDIGVILLELLRAKLAAAGMADRLDPPTGREKREVPWLGATAVAAIVDLAADFPGNVRTLGTIAHRLVASGRASERAEVLPVLEWLKSLHHQLRTEDAAASAHSAPPAGKPTGYSRRRVPDVTPEEFRALLEQNAWSIDRVAELLGLSRSTTYRWAQRDPLIPKTSAIDDAAILAALEAAAGDVERAADLVKLPVHHFKQRLARARRSS